MVTTETAAAIANLNPSRVLVEMPRHVEGLLRRRLRQIGPHRDLAQMRGQRVEQLPSVGLVVDLDVVVNNTICYCKCYSPRTHPTDSTYLMPTSNAVHSAHRGECGAGGVGASAVSHPRNDEQRRAPVTPRTPNGNSAGNTMGNNT